MRAGVSRRERRGAVLWEPGAGSRERCCTVNDRSPLPAPCSRRRSHSPGAARSLRPRWLRPVARVRCATCGGARGAHGRHPLCGRECTGRCGGAPGAEPARLRDDDSAATEGGAGRRRRADRKSTRLNSSHGYISYAVFCLKKKKTRAITAAVVTSTPSDLPAAPRVPTSALTLAVGGLNDRVTGASAPRTCVCACRATHGA